MGQALCRAVAQPWVLTRGVHGERGQLMGEVGSAWPPRYPVCLPPWLHLTGGLTSSEDPENRLLVRAGAGAGAGLGWQQGWGLWLSKVGPSLGPP